MYALTAYLLDHKREICQAATAAPATIRYFQPKGSKNVFIRRWREGKLSANPATVLMLLLKKVSFALSRSLSFCIFKRSALIFKRIKSACRASSSRASDCLDIFFSCISRVPACHAAQICQIFLHIPQSGGHFFVFMLPRRYRPRCHDSNQQQAATRDAEKYPYFCFIAQNMVQTKQQTDNA